MFFSHPAIRSSVFLLFALLTVFNCTHSKAIDNGKFIGFPKITLERPAELFCQEGWVVLGYDITDNSEILNVRILSSEPTGMFDEHVFATFNKLKPLILRKSPMAMKGITHKFTYSISDGCK